MTKRRRGQQLSLSLLDTMTCGFGAVILLFLLRQEVQRAEIQSLQRQEQVASSVQAQIGPARSHAAAWLDSASRRFVAAQGDGVLGLPPLTGDVYFLIDKSGSMINYDEKISAVVRFVDILMRTNKEIRVVRAGVFSGGPDDPYHIGPWEHFTDDIQRENFLGRVRECMSPQDCGGVIGGTNIVNAVAGTIKACLERGGCTIVLLSDGIGEEEKTLPSAVILDRIAAKSVALADARSIRLHAIGILGFDPAGRASDWGMLGAEFNIESQQDSTQSLTYVLQTLTFAYGGVLLLAPVAIGG